MDQRKTNDGGPAFPIRDGGQALHDGMSLRAYLAAHAPAVPEDFPFRIEKEHIPLPHRPANPSPDGGPNRKWSHWTYWADQNDFLPDTPPEWRAEFEAWDRARTEADERRRARDQRDIARRHAAWAIAYADAIIEALKEVR